jgi:hypothetical protein
MIPCDCSPLQICKCRPFAQVLLFPLYKLQQCLRETEVRRQQIYQKEIMTKDDETELTKISFLIIKLCVEIGIRELAD